MSCKLSEKCDNVFACNVLRPEVELLGCSFYKPKKPQTNEESLRQCNTEQLAEFIRKQRDDWSDGWYSDWHKTEEIIEWLKQKHTNE